MAEIKTLEWEIKLDENKRIVEGYASTFGNKDYVGDIVQPGAFKKTLKERANKVKVLWQHQPWEPIGIPEHMEEDSKGLYVKAKISKTTQGDNAIILLKDKVLDSFSIGYDVMKDNYDTETKTRYLNELKLHEFSLVTFPANPEATVTGVKGMDTFTAFLKSASGEAFSQLVKEGRTVSRANARLIENAIEALQAVLNIAEPDKDDEKGLGSTQQNDKKPLDIDTKLLSGILTNLKVK